jgi:V/A-type H+/Na+-transporting ATPase subunit E
MHESVQQLTNKIYQEGIEKAEARAREILEEAARKSRELVDEAEAKARQILENAEKNAMETRLKNEAEMKLSARQAMVALKQQITEMIVWKLNHETIKESVSDVAYMQELIRKIMDNWLEKFGQESRLQFILPQDEYQQYRQFLEQRTGKVIQTGISVAFTESMKNGFQVVAVDQGFKVSFTDDDFENYFSSFARPRIYKLLFGKED